MRARVSQLAVPMKYLQHGGARHAQQARQHRPVQAQVAAHHGDARAPPGEHVELIEHTQAAADGSGNGGAGHTKLGERTQSINEAGVERHVDQVGHP
jgi:hypothetical protein